MSSAFVVVDGSNIATEGRSTPSLAQLDDAVRQFQEQFPDVQVIVVVDATFGHRIDPSEKAAFDQAVAHAEITSPPAGAIGRGDAFLLRVAERVGAQVLSNDSFQEFHGEHPWLFEQGRLIGGTPVPGVGWIFTPRSPVRGVRSRAATTAAKDKSAGASKEAKKQKKAAVAPVAKKSPQLAQAKAKEVKKRASKSEPAMATTAKGLQSTKAAKTAKAAKIIKAAKTAKVAKTGQAAKVAEPAKSHEGEKVAKPPSAGPKVAKGVRVDKAEKVKIAPARSRSAKGLQAEKAAKAPKKSEAKSSVAGQAPKAAKAPRRAKQAAEVERAAIVARAAKVAKSTAAGSRTEKAPKGTGEAGEVTDAARPGSEVAVQVPARRRRRAPRVSAGEVVAAIEVATEEVLVPGDEVASQRSLGGRRRRGGPPAAVNDPLTFLTFVSDHPIGTEVEGTVASFTSHGAMVDVGEMHCYVPAAGLGDPPPRKAREVLERGEKRRFILVALDPPRRGAELALPELVDPDGARAG
jgi:hypothetical protein